MCEVPLSSTYTNWFMEETRLQQNAKYRMEQDGTLRRLTIHNVTTNDDGVYICEMKEGSRTVAELTVLGTVETLFLSTALLHCLALIKCNYNCLYGFNVNITCISCGYLMRHDLVCERLLHWTIIYCYIYVKNAVFSSVFFISNQFLLISQVT